MYFCFFFFKQKTAYEMRISDWSSDVCSSDLATLPDRGRAERPHHRQPLPEGRGAARAMIAMALALLAVVALVAAVGPATGYADGQIGRASCRERVCQYVSISVVAVSLKKKQQDRLLQHRKLIT